MGTHGLQFENSIQFVIVTLPLISFFNSKYVSTSGVEVRTVCYQFLVSKVSVRLVNPVVGAGHSSDFIVTVCEWFILCVWCCNILSI